MKKFALINAAFLTAFISFPFIEIQVTPSIPDLKEYKIKNSIACTPDRSGLSGLLDNEPDIPLMPGSGIYVWKIETNSDSAQFYFNQGINTYYGFHIIESIASFKKAARFDPENPMIWWAQALAYGPNINDFGYNTSPEALAATKKAIELSGKASPVEKALIMAMNVRYSEDSSKTRQGLNQEYTDAMKHAYEIYPSIPDVVVLYADAMMLQHPWDLWNINGTPKTWTPEIQKILEKALALSPMHPGANHYYIHVMEPSPYPEKALASAGILGKITPGLAHLVHMPSHIYLRTGQFNTGTAINEDAINRFKEYSNLFPAVSNGAFLYLLHNQHMLANCAMHAGRYKTAISNAQELQLSIDSATLATPPPMGSLIQYVYMSPVLINVRFEKWDSLLSMPKPAENLVYANILYHFGRGMAQAERNNIKGAKQEAVQLQELMNNEDLKILMTPFSAAIDGASCAREILNGSIALKENNFNDAIMYFNNAVQTEQKMVYDEPRDWLLNPNEYLGSAYMKAKDYAKAEELFKKDLTLNAKNVWSLYRLQQVLEKQKKMKSAAAARKDFNEAAKKADVDFASLYF